MWNPDRLLEDFLAVARLAHLDVISIEAIGRPDKSPNGPHPTELKCLFALLP